MLTIPLYSQRDPQWNNIKINNTASVLGLYGCTVTCLAMLFSAYGYGYNPGTMAAYLQSLGAFVNDLVLWTKIPFFVHRFYCEKVAAPVDEIRSHLRAGHPVLLAVHLGSGDAYKTNHWVLAIDENFTIYDPWYGEIAPITRHYGANPEKAILGGAYFAIASPVSEYPKEITVTAVDDNKKPAYAFIRTEPKIGSQYIAHNADNSINKVFNGTKLMAEAMVDGEVPKGYTSNRWYRLKDNKYISAAVAG